MMTRHGLFAPFLLAVALLMWSGAADASLFSDTLDSYFKGTPAGGCWVCPIFETLFMTIDGIAYTVAATLSDDFKVLLGVGILLFLAFKIGKAFMSVNPPDLPSFLDDVFKPLGRALVAVVLLDQFGAVFEWIIAPLFGAVLELATALLGTTLDNALEITNAAQDAGVTISKGCPTPYASTIAARLFTGTEHVFQPEQLQTLICWLEKVSNALTVGMALGTTFVKMAFENLTLYVIPDYQLLWAGEAIFAAFLLLFITFPIKLSESFIRLAFICGLMPLWIVLWVFPATAGYTKRAWEMLVSTCFLFVCLSVIISLILLMIDGSIPNADEVFELLIADETVKAAQAMDIRTKNLLIIVAFSFLGFKLLGTGTVLANTFSKGSGDNIIGASMQRGALAMAAAGVYAAKETTKAAAFGAAAGISKLDKRFVDKQKETAILDALANGRVTDSGLMLERKDWLGREQRITYAMDDNGQVSSAEWLTRPDPTKDEWLVQDRDKNVLGTRIYTGTDYDQKDAAGNLTEYKRGDDLTRLRYNPTGGGGTGAWETAHQNTMTLDTTLPPAAKTALLNTMFPPGTPRPAGLNPGDVFKNVIKTVDKNGNETIATELGFKIDGKFKAVTRESETTAPPPATAPGGTPRVLKAKKRTTISYNTNGNCRESLTEDLMPGSRGKRIRRIFAALGFDEEISYAATPGVPPTRTTKNFLDWMK